MNLLDGFPNVKVGDECPRVPYATKAGGCDSTWVDQGGQVFFCTLDLGHLHQHIAEAPSYNTVIAVWD